MYIYIYTYICYMYVQYISTYIMSVYTHIHYVCTTFLHNQRCLAGLMSQGRQLDTIQVRRQVWGILRRGTHALDNVYGYLYKRIMC